MSDAVIVALITGVISLIGTICTVLSAHRSTVNALDKKSELSDQKIHGEIEVIKTEITNLAKKVEIHNQMIERVYKLEQTTAVQSEKIDNLEKKAG